MLLKGFDHNTREIKGKKEIQKDLYVLRISAPPCFKDSGRPGEVGTDGSGGGSRGGSAQDFRSPGFQGLGRISIPLYQSLSLALALSFSPSLSISLSIYLTHNLWDAI